LSQVYVRARGQVLGKIDMYIFNSQRRSEFSARCRWVSDDLLGNCEGGQSVEKKEALREELHLDRIARHF
jgi:hypothetical protein